MLHLVENRVKKIKMLPQLLNQYNHSFYAWIKGAQEK
jgi:hypothetical protein